MPMYNMRTLHSSLILYCAYSFILWGQYYALFFILQAFFVKRLTILLFKVRPALALGH